MGCRGSKITRIKNALEQAVNSPLANREQPQGKTTGEQPLDEHRDQTDDKPLTKGTEGPLTTEQISLVQDTWRSVKESFNLQQVGVEFFVRLLTDSPELLQLFSFRDLDLSGDAMRNDPRLKKQALAIIQHVDLAVNSLNDLGSIVPALKDLGARHAMYNVKDHHFGPVGAALLNTLDAGLGEKFTLEVREAWTLVYGIVADTMKDGAKELLDA